MFKVRSSCLLFLVLLAWSLPQQVLAGDPFRQISVEDISLFIRSGKVNRNLGKLVKGAGWSRDEIRDGLTKSYEVNLRSMDRFLRSSDGEILLNSLTRNYRPEASASNPSKALRSAIIGDAADGSISALGIMEALPVDFVVSGPLSICAQKVEVSSQQRTSPLSYYLFLPACLRASQN